MNQGKFPYRINRESWEAVFKDHGWPESIPQSKGEEWARRRKAMAETVLTSKDAKQFIPVVVPIADNFTDCLAGHLTPDGGLVGCTIRQIVAMFALEAVMKVVCGVDFPACTVPIDKKALSFHQAVEKMFAASTDCDNLPWNVKFNLKPYQELKAAWEEMYSYPRDKLAPMFEYYEKHGKLPEGTKGTLLPKLFAQHEAGELSLEEMVGIGAQAISAAVDTTGQTTEYLLYNLARHPTVQDRLSADIINTFGSEGPLEVSQQQYESQQYLFAVLKESMRLTPTIGAHVRTLVQDAQLGKYKVPKDEVVMINYLEMTKNPDIFPEPDLFLPERFLKQKGKEANDSGMSDNYSKMSGGCPMMAQRRAEAVDSGKAVCNDPFAAIPFGHGGRRCLGKGFAEMDIHLAIISLLRKFKIHYDGPDLQVQERSLLRPKQPLDPHFRFEVRM